MQAIGNALKYSSLLNEKAEPIASPSSAFRCKTASRIYNVDGSVAVVAIMPRPGQPGIEYKYTSGFIIYSPDQIEAII